MCSYKKLHPTDMILKILIKTIKKSPIDIMKNALKNIKNKLNDLKIVYNNVIRDSI